MSQVYFSNPDWKKVTLAVREAGVSRHNGGSIEILLKLLNTIVLWWSDGFQGTRNGPTWCLDTPVSQTPLVVAVFRVCVYVWNAFLSLYFFVLLQRHFSVTKMISFVMLVMFMMQHIYTYIYIILLSYIIFIRASKETFYII